MAYLDNDSMNRRAQTFCLLTLTTIASGAALYFLRPVLVPFVLAVFLTYCLTPAIDVQTRYLRMPRLLAAISALILALAVLAIFGSLVATSVGSMSQKLQDYEKQFQRLTEQFAQSVPLAGLGLGSEGEIGRFFTVQEGTGWQFISAVLGEATNLVSNGALVAIFMIFILLGRRAQQPRANGILAEIETRVKSYIVQTVFFSALTGLLVALTLAVLGVEFAWVFGLLTFLLNFVPSIGSIIATLLPLPVILLTPELSITAKVLALLIPAAIQFVIGNLVQPRVQGGALDLHPVAVLLALIFFGMIWGVSGAFLATPITAVVRIVLGRIPITRPLSDLLAGRLDVIPGEGGQPRQDAVPGDERP